MDEFRIALCDSLVAKLKDVTLQSELLKEEIPAAMIRLHEGDGATPRFGHGLDAKLEAKNSKQRRDIANAVRRACGDFIEGWHGETPGWYHWDRVEMVIDHISGGQEICQSCGTSGGGHSNRCRESDVN